MSLRSMLLPLLAERASVYEANASGRFTVLIRAALPCRKVNIVRRGDTVTVDRVELLGQRTLYYDPEFEISDQAQVELDGERWNVIANTGTDPKDGAGAVAYRSCIIARAA